MNVFDTIKSDPGMFLWYVGECGFPETEFGELIEKPFSKVNRRFYVNIDRAGIGRLYDKKNGLCIAIDNLCLSVRTHAMQNIAPRDGGHEQQVEEAERQLEQHLWK